MRMHKVQVQAKDEECFFFFFGFENMGIDRMNGISVIFSNMQGL